MSALPINTVINLSTVKQRSEALVALGKRLEFLQTRETQVREMIRLVEDTDRKFNFSASQIGLSVSLQISNNVQGGLREALLSLYRNELRDLVQMQELLCNPTEEAL